MNCKRPKQRASSFPVIPTKWVYVFGEGAKPLEYCSKVCEKELKRLFDMMSGSVACATSDVASELPTDEQVVCHDLTGEFSNSLSEVRKETYSWKTKWRHVFVNHKPQSSTVVCCHERELCGFVHGDDYIIKGDSVQLMWIESRLKERLNFERCADLGVDDGDRMVTILNRLVTWSNQIGI